jgi:methanogenic corrinoid protein MtbC1
MPEPEGGGADSQKASPSAVSKIGRRAFSGAFPRLLAQVNDKFAVDARVLKEEQPENLEFIYDAHRHFGDMLSAVYEFGLYENMLDEFAWYVSTLSSRGFGETYFRRMVEAWIIAVHSTIKPPESSELSAPLEYLCRNLHDIYSAAAAEAPPLDPEAQHFLSLILNKDRRGAAEYVLSLLERGDAVERVYSSVVLPALGRLGALWQGNDISVADEHAATEISRYALFRLIDSIPRERPLGKQALVACVPGEEHDIGAQIASGYLEAKGWDVVYVGRSAPADAIIKTIEARRPQVAVFSINLIARLPAARDLFLAIRSRFPGVKIIAGGHAAIVARQSLTAYVHGIAGGPEDLHTLALRLVGQDA